jgi:hypothetical protein
MVRTSRRSWSRVATVAALTAVLSGVLVQPAHAAATCDGFAYRPFLNVNDRVQAHVIGNCTAQVYKIHLVATLYRRTASGSEIQIGQILKDCFSNNVCDAWPTGPCAYGPNGYFSTARGYYQRTSSGSHITLTYDQSPTEGIYCT